jgi:hypothetical protein
MPKLARFKEDGYVMNFNPEMDRAKFDFFEVPEGSKWPEFIADLPAFLAGETQAQVNAKPARKKNEPVFLKAADGAA